MAMTIAAALTLTACNSTPPRLSALDRDPTEADVLPVRVPAMMREDHRTRLVAAQDGIRYFVAQATSAPHTCVTAVPDDRPDLWISACSDQTDPAKEIVRTEMKGVVSLVLVPDDYDSSHLIEEGFRSVQRNILVAQTPGHVPSA